MMSKSWEAGKAVKTTLKLLCASMLGAGLMQSVASAVTDGTASFTVTLNSPPGNYSQRVDAFWVTTDSGTFVQNVRKDAATRQGYLYQWAAVRTTTAIDGFSGATINTWGAFTVPWDCRDVNNALVPDGTYRFWVEVTDHNGQGWYTTNGIPFVKGPSGIVNTYPDMGYFTGMSVTYTPLHDIAVTGMEPNVTLANTNISVTVAVTNLTGSTESFSVVLTNVTSGALIGTQPVGSLAGLAVTNVAFQWTTPGVGGGYSLRATAGPVTGETSTADNSLTHTVTVQLTPHDIAVLSLAPSLAAPNTNVNVSVVVTNETGTAESFSVVLTNLTTSSLIGTQPVSNLPGYTAVTVTFPWSTVGLLGGYQLQATAGPVTDEPANAIADNTLAQAVTVRVLVPDVAITGVNAPALVPPSSAAGLSVIAANVGEMPESFNVQLWDDTDGKFVGPMWQIPNLHVSSSVSLPLTFTTTNSTLGYHTLRAVASPVPNETLLPNNTNLVTVIVANGWGTNTFIARGSTWAYNDQGIDLTATPWRATNYYDLAWSEGPAPLGYSESGLMTNISTVVGWGADAGNKHSASYFRQSFAVDWLPVSLMVNTRRVDGLVLYLNGSELARFNMPTGAVTYATLASSPVTGAAQYAWLSTNTGPASLVLGLNTLAAEVHRANVSGSDLAFDVEVLGAAPQVPANHEVDAVALTAPANVLAGDQMPVTATVTNRGNVTETVLVLLVNSTTGQVVGSKTISGLLPGGSASVNVDWGTLGTTLPGDNQLVAYTVTGGVTNFVGTYTTSASISGSVFSTNNVNAAGSIGGQCSAVSASGSLLLAGAGATLQVWDRSNPAAPVQVGAVRLPGLIQSIAINGSYAFAACGSAGVQFVDLSNPSLPVQRLTMNTSGNAWSVAVSGGYLFVADGVSGLRIVNIANPAAPVLAGAYYTVGPARAVTVVGTTAYLLDQHEGLLLLDVSSPAAPSLVGSYAEFDSGQSLAVSGSTAYVVDGNNHLFVINVSNPASPSLTGSLLLANRVGRGLVVNGTSVYVAAGTDGLLTIDVSTPAAPSLISATAMPGEAGSLALAGSSLYVADGFAGFQVFDVSTPASPSLQGDFPVGLRGSDVAVANNIAYVAAGESGLRLFNIANTAAPALLSRFTAAANARAIAVSGTTAYVGDGQYGLKIVDVSNPAAPALLGTFASTNLASIRNVAVSGSQVVVSDGRTVMLLDASSPASPALLGSYATPAFAFSLCVANSKAYLACGTGGIIILNVAPGGLSLLGSYTDYAQYLATGIAVSGTTAYASYIGLGWVTLDVSNPASPALVHLSSAQGPVSTLAAAGTLVTVFSASNSAVTVDASAPLAPVARNAFGPLVQAFRLAATPSLILTAEDEAGLAILSTAPAHVVLYVERGPGNSSIRVRWASTTGQTYSVWKSTNLAAGFSLVMDNVTATPPQNTITDTIDGPAAFYIITLH